MRLRHLPIWSLLAVALVAALVIGSGVLESGPPTPAQRAAAIESVIRCPSCEDLSVATSTAPTAVAVRTTVTQQIAAGKTDQQIEDYLVTRYGSAIVLDPPAHGWSLLVWLVPLVGGAIALGGLGVVLYRRSVGKDARDGHDEEAGAGDRTDVEGRRGFLTRSLADADAEFLAGDLSDRDYLTLRQRDLARLAALPAAEAAGTELAPAGRVATIEADGPDALGAPASGASDRGEEHRSAESRVERSRPSRWLLRGSVAAFISALVLAVALFVTTRQPGGTVTGSVPLTQSQRTARTLSQAATDESNGQLGTAAQLYQSVLTSQPDDEVALAQLGWLEYRVGSAGGSTSLLADAQAKLGHAVALAPGDFAARLYLGTLLLLAEHNPAGAVAQYQAFLADTPPTSVVQQAAPELRQAYQQAGVPVPATVP